MNRTNQPGLLLTTSPFLKDRADTRWVMWQVNLALVPVVLAATYIFGLGALLTISVTTCGAALPEWLHGRANKRRPNPIRDGSAVITGILLSLTLPPGIPLWMAFVGGVVAVSLGKIAFGGIGFSSFNPALVGRAFLQAAFPAAMTTWSSVGGLGDLVTMRGAPFTLPFLRPAVDAVTTATPLSQMKYDGLTTDSMDLMLGQIPGSLGETSAILILLAGLYLAVRKVLNWRIPIAIFASAFVFGSLLHWLEPTHPTGLFHLFSGGLVLGAVFMATDPVSSPITQAGCWVFGVGIGMLVVVIRVFGGLPEGVMYAILLFNAAVPIINRITQPRSFGTRHHPKWTR
jgi:electron transport complex protein RnfD